jgi:hypothetical protein
MFRQLHNFENILFLKNEPKEIANISKSAEKLDAKV